MCLFINVVLKFCSAGIPGRSVPSSVMRRLAVSSGLMSMVNKKIFLQKKRMFI